MSDRNRPVNNNRGNPVNTPNRRVIAPSNQSQRQANTTKNTTQDPINSSKKSNNQRNTSHTKNQSNNFNYSTGNDLRETERQLSFILKSESQKTESVKKELHKRASLRFREQLRSFSKCFVIAAVIFSIVASLIILLYYRSMTKYSSDSLNFIIRGYDYIDISDDSESTIKRLEARKKGTEKPAFDLEGKLTIRNNIPYIPYSSVDDYFGFSIAGDNNSRSISVGDSSSDFNGMNVAYFRFDSNEIRVNGSNHILDGVSFYENGEFYFPYEFLESYVHGISIDKSIDKKLTVISVTKLSENIYFGGSSNTPLQVPEYSAFFNGTQPEHTYNIDVSGYEKYINPQNNDKYLILVNINNKLDPDYTPEDMHDIKTAESRPVQQICFDAAMSLNAMLRAADAAGYTDLAVTTGYRSYTHQSSLFNQKLKTNLQKYDDKALAEKITSESVIFPGASEHQTGLAIDLHNMSAPMQSFANTDEYKWLVEHCADFGYILRYPQTKEDITGVKYEPWHFRFVGRDHAQKIMTEGISLEEYLLQYQSTQPEQNIQ